jgi:protein-disulfide isomerase
LVGLVAAAAIVALAGAGCGSTSQAQPTVEPTPKTITIDPGDNPSKGPADAKVTIVEFGDFQAPHSRSFAEQTLPQILSNYGDEVRFVFVNYPLKKDSYAQEAAEAGECANAQGAFWQYHDLLFQNQQALSGLLTTDPTAGLAKVVESLKGYAAQLSLDAAKFSSCLDSGKMATAVETDKVLAAKAYYDTGLTSWGSPCFFINGNYLSGSKPYAVFKQAIDAALAAAK